MIVEIQPRSFLLENVPYIAAKRGRRVLDKFLRLTESAGYKVSTAIINAMDFGVPQNRPRFIAIGFREGPAVSLSALSKTSAHRANVRDAIASLPPAQRPGAGEHPDLANHVGAHISKLNKQRISYVPQGGGWKDIPKRLQLACHKNHRGHGHLDVFGRLKWVEVAQTITAHSDSFSRGRYAHPV